MHISILGASGLIGHKLYQILGARFDRVDAVLHGPADRFRDFGLFESENVIENVDVLAVDDVLALLDRLNPDVVLNCAGITKRRPEINNARVAIFVNALFPHLLADWAKKRGKRVIHFSTDCVFDGTIGNYNEDSDTTGKDAYGKTKALGEIRYEHTLTLRSSFIGQELSVHSELLDWFLAQRGKTITGFTQAYYSGISTPQMARVVGDIIESHPDLSGLYQLSMPEPINKFQLLGIANEAYGMDIDIRPDDSFEIMPTLDGSALRMQMKLELPTWDEMMAELAQDSAFYPALS